MRQHGYRFRVVPSGASERVSGRPTPTRLVRALALRKALSVAESHPDHPVLGADTIVFIDGKIVGKPRNPAHARRMLQSLSGVWQRVYTGVAVVWEGENAVRLVRRCRGSKCGA